MRVMSLGSGSSGNAYLVQAGPQGRTRLLLDAGFSLRNLLDRLRLAGTRPEQLQGVLVTHEHSDHILGLPLLMQRYHLPVFTEPRTQTELQAIFSGGPLLSESGALVSLERQLASDGDLPGQRAKLLSTDDLWQSVPAGSQRVIGDITVTSFPVSHDAVAPCGYLLSAGGCRVCLVTDTGEVTPVMLEAMAQADLLILEANHDRARLFSGPYPYHLKQRILSASGHLSNDQAAAAVLLTWRPDGLRWLWLAHLSRVNNTPKLALSSMHKSLNEAGVQLSQLHISVLSREVGSVWDSTRLWRDDHLWDL